jgi:hypothetical protein
MPLATEVEHMVCLMRCARQGYGAADLGRRAASRAVRI